MPLELVELGEQQSTREHAERQQGGREAAPRQQPARADQERERGECLDARAEQGWSWGVDLHHWHEPGAPHNEAAWAERVGMPLDLFTNLE